MLIILLPGMDGTGLLFDPFLECLTSGTQTKVVSYPPSTHLSYEELEGLLARELPPAEQYVIVAESFSGPIAL